MSKEFLSGCGMGLIPGLGTSTLCHRHSQNKTKPKKTKTTKKPKTKTVNLTVYALKGRNSHTCYNINEPKRHSVKWNKSVTKRQTWFHVYEISK